MTQANRFDVIALNPAAWSHPGVAVSAARAGATGVLDLEFCPDSELAAAHFARLLAEAGHGEVGLRAVPETEALALALLAAAPADRPLTLIASGPGKSGVALARAMRKARSGPKVDRLLLEVLDAGVRFGQLRPDAVIVKGFEAPGWNGEDSSYLLAQKVLAWAKVPVYVRGGIGPRGAAAVRAAGAAGVVLDDQLLLCDEAALSDVRKAELAKLNGAETRSFGDLLGSPCRIYARPGSPALKQAQRQLQASEAKAVAADAYRALLLPEIGWGEKQLLPVGQGIGVAVCLKARRVARVIREFNRESFSALRLAGQLGHLSEHGPLAVSHGTRYPLVQGPMTRVSDNADFAVDVAKGGALPFLALALMRGEQVDTLLAETASKMNGRAWGVGLLGFVPQALRDEQCEAIWKHKPPFALIAGGRPDQAAQFEERGIPAYIHVPAPQLLKMYLDQGARRFVFEGRECGGHIGPIASFPLWEQMIAVLLEQVSEADAEQVHVLFAGGINDAQSGAMLAAMTAPLAARGIRVGALMGTAYLFTKEIVASGAVVQGFQDEALACEHTTSLETGPGHATRCVDTAFAREFQQRRRDLLRAAVPAEEVRDSLEDLNLGRLRLASKGRTRGDDGQILEVSPEQQKTDGMYMIGQVATLRDRVTTIEALHVEVCEVSASRLEAEEADVIQRTAEAQPSDVAVVGIGMVLPRADDADQFWSNVMQKVSVITEVPRSRWDWRMYYDADKDARDKVYSKWGGFLDEITFDPTRFGIPPRSMKSIDPMQLLSLECTARALDDAGLDEDFDRENTSIILGAGGGVGDLGMQYGVRSEMPRFIESPDDAAWDRLPEWTNESFAGVLQNVAAGRVANRMNFGGLNFTVDAACGSSLAAVTLAVQELESGRSNVAIAGGVDTVQGPFGFLCFSKTQALSPQGVARTFDKNADGIVISEGVAMVVLKRLADAEADGDRIYAVIKAAAGSSDGKALGMTAPRPEGQMRALDRVYSKAGFGPGTVELVEAHGTGTPVGDRAEAETITRTWSAHGAAPKSVALGSIKTILGHTKCAAGVSGLIKVALSLHHRVLPAHVGVTDPIDVIASDDSPVYLLNESRPWLTHAQHPRRAAVSAFGFGGTNFHAVLEEYRGNYAVPEATGARHWPSELFALRAADANGLLKQVRQLLQALAKGSQLGLAEIAHSVAAEADKHPGAGVAAAFVVDSHDAAKQALAALEAHLDGSAPLPPNVVFNAVRSKPQHIALLFPGQGAQNVGMGCEAGLYFEPVRRAVEAADTVLKGTLARPLSSIMWPESAFTDAQRAAQHAMLTDTRHAQPAIGTLSLGHLGILRSLGVDAQSVAGHSYGEYTALHAAGVIDEESFLQLSAARGAAMADAGNSEAGTMAAIQTSRDAVAALMEPDQRVWIANHNAPEQVVVSGAAEAVEALCRRAEAQSLRVLRLPVSGAFHTELVRGAQAPLSSAIDAVAFAAPQRRVYGNHGAAYGDDPEAIRTQLKAHLLSPVEFVAELQQMADDGVDLFIECGPKAICGGMAWATLGDAARVVSMDGKGGGLRGLLSALAELYCAGIDLPLGRMFAARGIRQPALAQLAVSLAPPELAKTTWYLSGGCARPMSDPVLRMGNEAPLTLETKQAAASKRQHAPAAATVPAPAAAQSSLSAAGPSATPVATDAFGSEALAAYQQTMQQFLALQEQVMARVLGGQGPAASAQAMASLPAAVLPAAQGHSAAAATPAATPSPVAITETSAEATTAVPATPAFDAKSALLALVADRTGYPEDMIALEADLEADLGIDSIKRVEIVGAFAKQVPEAMAQAMAADMESYTRARSLQALLDVLPAVAVEAAAPAGPAASAPAAPVASAPFFDAKSVLLALVADRTGYPEDMIALDADLEADLGIDSIKRVEIVGAFAKQVPEAMAQAMAADMESYTRARSLQALLDVLPAVATEIATPDGSAASAPAAPVASAPAFDAKSVLLALVADRTGYPEDMIALDADLEADLGIDSIKRVEIVGAFAKLVPEAMAQAMAADMESYTRARSLQALLDVLPRAGDNATVTAAPAAAEPAVAAAATAPADSEAVARFVIRAREIAPVGDKVTLRGTLLIVGADVAPDCAQAMAVIAESNGLTALPCEARTESELADIVAGIEVLAGVVQLDGLLLVKPENALEAGRRAVMSTYATLRALGARCADARMVVATRLGGTLGRDAVAEGSSVAGGVVGLLNCARHEYPDAHLLPVDVNGQSPESMALRLFEELASTEKLPEVGYVGDARYTSATVAEPLADTRFAPHLDPQPDWVVLATGGARGITASILARLAKPGMTLVLAGRSALPDAESPELAAAADDAAVKKLLITQAREQGKTPKPAEIDRTVGRVRADREIRDAISRLTAAGATVDYRPLDVRDADAVRALVEDIYSRHGRIDAVLHGAGVIEDKLLVDKSEESFARVFSTKVDSAIALAQALRPDLLKLMALFTSVAGRYGNRGQADYAAANEALNRLAWQWSRAWKDTRVMALNWGPWDAGMATDSVKQAFRARGIIPIPLQAGCDYFLQELACGPRHEVELVIGQGPWQDMEGGIAADAKAPDRPPLLRGDLRIGAGGSLQLEQTLGLSSDPWLADHMLDGEAVLPAAVAVEWMAQVAEAGWPGWQVAELLDLRVLAGIRLDRNADRPLLVRARASSHSGGAEQLLTLEILDPAQKQRVCYRASVRIVERLERAPEVPELASLGDASTLDSGAAYSQYLFHGDCFRRLDGELRSAAEGVDAVVRASTPAAFGLQQGSWLFDPGLLDVIPQLAIIWSRVRFDTTPLPSSVASIRRYAGAATEGPLRVVWRARPDSSAERAHYDAWVMNADGHVVLAVEGAEGTASSALNRLAGA